MYGSTSKSDRARANSSGDDDLRYDSASEQETMSPAHHFLPSEHSESDQHGVASRETDRLLYRRNRMDDESEQDASPRKNPGPRDYSPFPIVGGGRVQQGHSRSRGKGAMDAKSRRRNRKIKKELKMLKVGSRLNLDKGRGRSGSDVAGASFSRVSVCCAYEKVSLPLCINGIKSESCQYPSNNEPYGEVGSFMSRVMSGFNWGEEWGWKIYNGEVLHFFLLNSDDIRSKGGASPSIPPAPPSRSCDIFVYSYGCLVFWGLTPSDEVNFIESLERFSEGRRGKGVMKDSSDTMLFTHEEDIGRDPDEMARFDGAMFDADRHIFVKNDRLLLSSSSRTLKLSLSFAMSQSCNLFVLENLVTETIEETRGYPENLQRTGTFGLSRKETRKIMGRVYVDRCKVTLYSDLLEVPDYFWDSDVYEPCYQVMKSYLDLTPRINILNTRLTVLDDLLIMLNSLTESSHSSHLEWIIIWLIGIELFFQVGWNIGVKDLDLFGLREEYGWGGGD